MCIINSDMCRVVGGAIPCKSTSREIAGLWPRNTKQDKALLDMNMRLAVRKDGALNENDVAKNG